MPFDLSQSLVILIPFTFTNQIENYLTFLIFLIIRSIFNDEILLLSNLLITRFAFYFRKSADVLCQWSYDVYQHCKSWLSSQIWLCFRHVIRLTTIWSALLNFFRRLRFSFALIIRSNILLFEVLSTISKRVGFLILSLSWKMILLLRIFSRIFRRKGLKNLWALP